MITTWFHTIRSIYPMLFSAHIICFIIHLIIALIWSKCIFDFRFNLNFLFKLVDVSKDCYPNAAFVNGLLRSSPIYFHISVIHCRHFIWLSFMELKWKYWKCGVWQSSSFRSIAHLNVLKNVKCHGLLFVSLSWCIIIIS